MLVPFLVGLGGTSAVLLLVRLLWPSFFLDLYYIKQYSKFALATGREVRKGNNMIDIFEDKVRLHPSKTFLIYEGRRFSYEEVDRLANRAARAFLEIGVKPGDVVSVMIHNEPAIVWTHLGLLKAGIRTSFMNFNLRLKSLAHCVNATDSKYLIVGEGEKLADAVREILPDISGVNVYQQGRTQDHKPHNFRSFDDVMARVGDAVIDRAMRKPFAAQTSHCLYIFTSGTTGLPKPAVYSYQRQSLSAHVFTLFDLNADDVLYAPLPMYHSSGFLLLSNTIGRGATMVLKDKFSASDFWDDCRKYEVTFIQYIGEICRYLVSRPKNKLDGVHKIQRAFGNGLRPDIWAEFQDRFKIPKIYEFYGATEGPVALFNLANRFGACGRLSPLMNKVFPAYLVKYDLEAQQPVRNRQGRCVPAAIDEAGLFIVSITSGKTFFDGYTNKKATEKKLLRDVFTEGDVYFNSGDLLRMDKDYFLYFNDRIGDTFRWKGENVSTNEVSNILTDVEFIEDANVFGVMIAGTEGRAGMASLILSDRTQDGLSSHMLLTISKHIQETLPGYARPRFLRVQKEFALTSTYKQQKMKLVEEGFDVTKVNDPLYYLNPATNSYEALDHVIYSQIMAGKIPM